MSRGHYWHLGGATSILSQLYERDLQRISLGGILGSTAIAHIGRCSMFGCSRDSSTLDSINSLISTASRTRKKVIALGNGALTIWWITKTCFEGGRVGEWPIGLSKIGRASCRERV